MDWQATKLSLVLSTSTTLILLPICILLGYWLAHSKSLLKSFVESALCLPMVLPPTVLGFYLLMMMGHTSPVGFWFEELTGKTLVFSFQGLVVGSVIYGLPFALQPCLAAFSSVHPKWVETSWTLGISKFKTFCRVILPLSWPGILAGMILSFAHTLGEFGLVLMIGGNIPGVTRTLSISIYDDVQALDYRSAGKTSLVLLIFAFIVLTVSTRLRKRSCY